MNDTHYAEWSFAITFSLLVPFAIRIFQLVSLGSSNSCLKIVGACEDAAPNQRINQSSHSAILPGYHEMAN